MPIPQVVGEDGLIPVMEIEDSNGLYTGLVYNLWLPSKNGSEALAIYAPKKSDRSANVKIFEWRFGKEQMQKYEPGGVRETEAMFVFLPEKLGRGYLFKNIAGGKEWDGALCASSFDIHVVCFHDEQVPFELYVNATQHPTQRGAYKLFATGGDNMIPLRTYGNAFLPLNESYRNNWADFVTFQQEIASAEERGLVESDAVDLRLANYMQRYEKYPGDRVAMSIEISRVNADLSEIVKEEAKPDVVEQYLAKYHSHLQPLGRDGNKVILKAWKDDNNVQNAL